jgi:hypothetical protein
MGKQYRLEDDLLKKSRPKFGSQRFNRMSRIAPHAFYRCEICGSMLSNPQSIIIHQGNFCQNKIAIQTN